MDSQTEAASLQTDIYEAHSKDEIDQCKSHERSWRVNDGSENRQLQDWRADSDEPDKMRFHVRVDCHGYADRPA